MIDLKELNKLLDKFKATKGLDTIDKLSDELWDNAEELIRLAEIGKRTEEFMADKKDHDDYMSDVTEFFNKSGARI